MYVQDTKTSEQKAKEGTEFKKQDISKQTKIDNKDIDQVSEKAQN